MEKYELNQGKIMADSQKMITFARKKRQAI